MIKIKRGLDLPIAGSPEQQIHDGPKIRTVGVVGFDYVGLKPTMAVQVGDKVKKGQLLFTDKKTEGVRYTAPASGTVAAINRGAKRVFQSLVIEVDDNAEAESFPSWESAALAGLGFAMAAAQACFVNAMARADALWVKAAGRLAKLERR